MEPNKRDIKKILGYQPSREQLLLILKDVSQGKTIYQACDRFAMPPLILCLDGEEPPPPDYPGQRRVIVRGPNDNETNKEK